LAPLVLVVGPSGAGKDSLIDGARRALADDPAIHFARRVITRSAANGEDHDVLDETAFATAERNGAFLLTWRAHGLCYGIPAAAQNHRSDGVTVVANASRAIVDDARRRLAPVHVIAVTAPAEMLAERLYRRGRESGAEWAERLATVSIALPDGPDVTRILNDRSLAEGQALFIAALRRIRAYAT
jgi:phosphonate metabolism protein PhnN/1,5-bisphosphokinase (PRPP-forming)